MAYSPDAFPSSPAIANVTMVLANTEYSVQMPRIVKKFLIHTRDESIFRLAFVTGLVAAPVEPYLTILAGKVYYEDHVNLRVATADWDGTLYFASPNAGRIVEVLYWV